MPIHTMTRNATDNVYFHRDFHGIFSLGIDYLHERYGVEAVIEYLRRFALHFYAPLIETIREKSLDAVAEAFVKTYEEENSLDQLRVERSGKELWIHVDQCPAVTYMQENGVIPSRHFSLTSSVPWETVCQAAGLGYRMLSYDSMTGKADHLFFQWDSHVLPEGTP